MISDIRWRPVGSDEWTCHILKLSRLEYRIIRVPGAFQSMYSHLCRNFQGELSVVLGANRGDGECTISRTPVLKLEQYVLCTVQVYLLG